MQPQPLHDRAVAQRRRAAADGVEDVIDRERSKRVTCDARARSLPPATGRRVVHLARFGTGSRSSPSFTSGSMMFVITSEDVVSVARPGSSEGGSVPQFR
jgi:hypothetical protein